MPRNLLVVSHVRHYDGGGQLHAYGPYVREIEIWADLFEEVRIAAPRGSGDPPGDCLPFTRTNVRLVPQRELGGDTLGAKLKQLALLPLMAAELGAAMIGCDALHVRCPGNLGLLGVMIGRLFIGNRVAKYAGQWTDFPGEARSVRLQKWLLRSRWWGAPVTVYGRWPNQPEHVVPFFTSILDEDQMERARRSALEPRPANPLRILYVGRLSTAKNVDVLVEAVAELKRRSIPVVATLVGDGPQRAAIESRIRELGVEDRIHLAGAVDHDRVLDHYEAADLLVLTSETEGWPKAITEAMAFGLVCVGSDRGLVPQILGEGRGFVVPPRDAARLADVLASVALGAEDAESVRRRAAAWAQGFTLESLRDALKAVLEEQWQATLMPLRREPAEIRS